MDVHSFNTQMPRKNVPELTIYSVKHNNAVTALYYGPYFSVEVEDNAHKQPTVFRIHTSRNRLQC